MFQVLSVLQKKMG